MNHRNPQHPSYDDEPDMTALDDDIPDLDDLIAQADLELDNLDAHGC